jgi:poly-gamma-glutamate capsule biosynthesis protein CapA/YwtB (metallophosphatase superfamily)
MLTLPRRLRVPAAAGGVLLVAALAAPSAAPASQAIAKKSAPPRRMRAVTLAFAGDIHFEGTVATKLARDPASVLAPVAPLLRRADVAVVNLETAVTDRGTAVPKDYNFRAPASALTALKAAGIDAASMANNHGMDFGPVGLMDSLAAGAAARFPLIGIGRNDTEAFLPYRTVVRGQRIAIIAATQVIDKPLIASWTAGPRQPGLASAKDLKRITRAVREARKTSDTVVVYLHWGVQGSQCPSVAQRGLADSLIKAGADVVVGTHAHALQGAGRSGGAFVAYGLGNFAFYTRGGPGTQTGVLTLTVTGRHVDKYVWSPAAVRSGVPTPLAGSPAVQAVSGWNQLRRCTPLTP